MGPSNAAVDNLAQLIDRISVNVCNEANQGIQLDSPYRARRRLVVRAFDLETELMAMLSILEGKLIDRLELGKHSKWTLPLTPTSWLLVLLGSNVSEHKLHPDDSEQLCALHREIQSLDGLTEIQQLAAGEIAFSQVSVKAK